MAAQERFDFARLRVEEFRQDLWYCVIDLVALDPVPAKKATSCGLPRFPMIFRSGGIGVLLVVSDEVLPPEEFSEIAIWKMEQRKRDMQDIATGRRTPEEVQRDNSWLIPYPEPTRTLNLIEACEKL